MGKITYRSLVTLQSANCIEKRDLSVAISLNLSKKCKTFSFYIVKLYLLSDLRFLERAIVPIFKLQACNF